MNAAVEAQAVKSAEDFDRSWYPRAPLWPGLCLSSGVLVLLVLYWAIWIRRQYFPAGDEFSLLVHSTRFFHPRPAEWFRRGFAGYFEPYPDLSLPYSNFLRPLANLTYFVQSLFFGRRWSMYLLGNYTIVAATVLVVWDLSRRHLRLSVRLAMLVSVGAAVSPAVSYQAILRPSFAFDLLGALWALLALSAILRERWWLGGSLVLLAMFTKETAYYAAPAAAVTAFLLFHRLRFVSRILRAAAYLLPLLLVVLLRRLDFRGSTGVYVLNEMVETNPRKRFVLALTHWPYLLPGEQHIFEHSLHNLAALSITFVCWALVCFFASAIFRERTARRSGLEFPPRLLQGRLSLLVFLLGALVLPVGLDLGPRFGASVYPLLFLAMATTTGLFDRLKSSPLRSFPTLLLALIAVFNAWALAVSLLGPAYHREQRLWARSRNLVALLATEQQPVVFLVADGSESFASPRNVAQFSAYHGTIVPVSNMGLGNCPDATLQVAPQTTGIYPIHLLTPAGCGENSLGATFHATPRRQSEFARDLPQAEITYNAHSGGWFNGQFSTRKLDLLLSPRVPAFTIIIPRREDAADLVTLSPQTAPR